MTTLYTISIFDISLGLNKTLLAVLRCSGQPWLLCHVTYMNQLAASSKTATKLKSEKKAEVKLQVSFFNSAVPDVHSTNNTFYVPAQSDIVLFSFLILMRLQSVMSDWDSSCSSQQKIQSNVLCEGCEVRTISPHEFLSLKLFQKMTAAYDK
ncbi:hypothetical protein PAMA_007281 [Pampus argenteus]